MGEENLPHPTDDTEDTEPLGDVTTGADEDEMPVPDEESQETGTSTNTPAQEPITIRVQEEPVTVDKETRVADLKEMLPDVEAQHTATFRGDDDRLYQLNDTDFLIEYLGPGDQVMFRFGDNLFGRPIRR